MCDRIKAAYPFAVLFVTGDATGANRAAISKGNINYYTVIRQHLGLNAPQMKTPSVNPAVSDNRVLLNAILQNGNILIDKIQHIKQLVQQQLKLLQQSEKENALLKKEVEKQNFMQQITTPPVQKHKLNHSGLRRTLQQLKSVV